MAAIRGSGEHRYRVVDGWQLTDVASVAVNSKVCIYVFMGSVDGGMMITERFHRLPPKNT